MDTGGQMDTREWISRDEYVCIYEWALIHQN